MINKQQTIKLKRRKVLVLSATFLCIFFLSIGCKKKKNPIGQDVLPSGSELSSSGIDTFLLRTYSTSVDSVISQNPLYNLLGKYNDPDFGIVEASFYTQLSLSKFSPDFGDFNEIEIDSVVMSFRYGGFYGTPSQQLFEIYEIDEELEIDEENPYYHFSTALVKSENLVPTDNNEGLIKPTPLEQSVVGNDTVEPLLRLPLKKDFGIYLLELASNSPSNESFIQSFKGLNFLVNSPNPTKGNGSIFYLESSNPSSMLTVYYTRSDSIHNKFDFLINNELVDFNNIAFDNTASNLERVLNDKAEGQKNFYAQAFSTRAKIEFPTLTNISKDAVVHEATLELPISYFAGSDFYPSASITVGAKLYEGNDQIFLISDNVTYNEQRRAYFINLRAYIQNIINGQMINDGIILSPRFFNTTTERIIFNGQETTNKMKPRLNITFTEF